MVDGIHSGISGFDGMARVGRDAILYSWSLLDPWCLAAASHGRSFQKGDRDKHGITRRVSSVIQKLDLAGPAFNDSHDWNLLFDGIQVSLKVVEQQA